MKKIFSAATVLFAMNSVSATDVATAVQSKTTKLAAKEQAAPTKGTAFFDSIYVLQASNEGKDLIKGIQKDVETFQSEFKQAQQSMVEAQESLNKQAKKLSAEALREKTEELAQKNKKSERDFAERQEQLRGLIEKKQVMLRQRQVGMISEELQKDGWSAILDKNTPGVYYVAKSLDKTEEALAKVNASYVSPAVKVAANTNAKSAVATVAETNKTPIAA